MRVRKIGKLAVAIGCSLVVVNASWGTLIDIGDQIQQTQNISVWGRNVTVYHTTARPSGVTVSAGRFSFSFNIVGPGGKSVNNLNIGTYCTDIGVWAGTTGQRYIAEDFSTELPPIPNGVAPNWNTNPDGIQNAAWLYNQKYSDANTQDKAAAMQIAIWEVLYDTTVGYNYASGNPFVIKNDSGKDDFYTSLNSGSVYDAAMGYLGALVSARANETFTVYDSTWLRPVQSDWTTTASAQGLLYDDVAVPVPEPTTVLAGLLLLLPFGASTFRILRKKA